MVQTPNQGQENAIVNRALTKVPRPHLTGVVLGKDIKLGDLQLNAIDDNDVVWVCTDIVGWWNLPDPETVDLDKGWGDGSYQSKGRYRTRVLELKGVILPPDASKITVARDTLVRAVDLVRSTAWLVVNEPDYTKAVKVRLSGKPNIDNVNARGRIEFSIGLVAVDPIKYQWFGDSLTTDYAETAPKNATGTQDGYVTIDNNGNYPVGAVYEIEGPIVSGGATIFNETNGDLLTITETTRGKMYRYANAKSMTNGTATITVTNKHDLSVGDEVEITLPENFSVVNFSISGNLVGFTLSNTHNFRVNDVFSVSGVDAVLDNQELVVFTTATHNTMTATKVTPNVSLTTVNNGSIVNITNKKLNGTFPVESVVNSYAFTYVTDYKDSITNTLVTYANSAPTVFRDADIIEIDTSNREVAFNGDASQKRGMLDTIVDWVKLDEGNNVIQFDDSNAETFWVNRYGVVANSSAGTDTITMYTTNAHGYSTSDTVTISNISSNVNTYLSKEIQTYSSLSNVVTVNVNAHGYTTGNYVVISGIGSAVDGLYAITNVNTDFFTFTTLASGNSYTTSAPDGATSRKVSKVSSYSRANALVTVIANSHGLYTNDIAYFTGLSNVVDGLYVVTNVNSNALSYSTRSNGTIASTNVNTAYVALRHQITDVDEYKIVVTKRPHTTNVAVSPIGAIASTDVSNEIAVSSISTNLVTNFIELTTIGEHGFSLGEQVQIVAEDSSSSDMDKYAVGTGYPIRITNWQRASNGLVTVNTITAVNYANAISTTDNYVTITNLDSSVDGTYKITSVNATNFTISTGNITPVSQTTVDNAYAKRLHKVIYYTRSRGNTSTSTTGAVKSYSQNGNTLTITTESNHNASNGDIVYLYNVKDELDYRPFTVVNTTAGTKTFKVNAQYSATDSNANSIGGYFNSSIDSSLNSVTGNLVYVVFDNAHNLSNGDSVFFSGLSASIDGQQRVIYVSTDTVVYIVDSNAVRVPRYANISRASGSNTVTVTTQTNHNFSVGDSIYVVGAGATGNLDGQWTMYSNINAKAFTYISGGTTACTITNTSVKVHASPVENYAEQSFPIISKTNNTFTYFHSKTNVSNTQAVTETPGKIVKNSDGIMRVYYRSGWIG